MLPKTTDKGPIPDDIHARLAAFLNGEPLLGAKPLVEVAMLDEVKRTARVFGPVEIPDGTHQKLSEAIDGKHETLPENIHTRAARALTR